MISRMLTSFETTEVSVSNHIKEVYTNFMKHQLFAKNKYETTLFYNIIIQHRFNLIITVKGT